ncbi:MAG: APC family permease [Acidimicrobiales bacterium]|jgi:amino acid transporter
MATTASLVGVSAPAADHAPTKGLKTGALGLVSSIVIGVASTAPAYSLAASLGLVTAAVGLLAPSVMLLAFIPMLFIAAAYFYLNRVDPDCGTTFTWVTRAIGPKTGWMAGWGILITDLVVMPSLAQIAGQYTFLLFGANGAANNRFWVGFLGVIWIIVMTAICVIGIELSARTQVGLLGAEIVILAIFAAVALAKVYGSHIAHSLRPTLGWLNPLHISSTGALAGAILTAVFIYWGWDTAVTVNEEAKDTKRTPGVAAVLSTLVLLGIYVIVSIAAQAFHGAGFLTANSNDVLNALSHDVFGSGWDKFLVLAVLTSASASTQTTILPAARSALSMSVHKAIPRRFGTIHPRFLTPAYATSWFGVLSIVWFVGLSILSNEVLLDSILALGFGIAFYYAMTGYACVIYYRRLLMKSLKNLVFVGLAPLVGALILTWAFLDSIFVYSNPANAAGDQVWFHFVKFNVHIVGIHFYADGLGPPLIIGLGLLIIGLPLMLAWMIRHREFFRHTAERAESLHDAAPPLTPGAPVVTD